DSDFHDFCAPSGLFPKLRYPLQWHKAQSSTAGRLGGQPRNLIRAPEREPLSRHAGVVQGRRAGATRVSCDPAIGRRRCPTRFRLEAKALRAINSRHFARYEDSGTAGGTPYLVMEYVKGPTLRALVGVVDERFVRKYGAQLCDGLRAAHESDRKLIHRDLKPDN